MFSYRAPFLLLAAAGLMLTPPPALAAGKALEFAMPNALTMPLSVAPEAGGWQPAVIRSVDALVPGAPPTIGSAAGKAEVKELMDWQARRTPEDLAAIKYWAEVPAPLRWSEEVRGEIITASVVPPRAARMLAIVHAAMYDATLVAWKAKAKYKRPLPAQLNPYLKPIGGGAGIPSYPSEHAAIAMAAAGTMAALFPDHADQLLQKARLVGETRIAAGLAHRSDVDAGLAIGAAVAKEILAARADDGADKPNPPLSKSPGKWWVEAPMETGAGSWKTWLMESGQQYRMTYDLSPASVRNPKQLAYYKEVEAVHAKLTANQIERAIYWNFDVPALLWNDIARRAVTNGRKPSKPDSMGIMWSDIARQAASNKSFDTPHTARMLNVLHLALADAFIACWDTKYVNRIPRPIHMTPAGQRLQTVVPTPPHPSWPSGHATASMAAAVVLGAYFPGQKKYFEDQAKEAAMSRLWGGIHFRKDNDDGLGLGKRVGDYCMKQATARGWTK